MMENFSKTLIAWYEVNKRDLPWRNTQNPYYIWLSEIILQQTRVDQGLPYYIKFVETFPTIEDLANASQDEVLRLWQGLGSLCYIISGSDSQYRLKTP
jgi:A/G-specific adenine glycosylase